MNVGVVGRLGAPRKFEDRVKPGAEVAGFGILVAAALEFADFAEGGLADILGQIGFFDAGAVILGAFGFVVAEFLADGSELLTKQEFALLLKVEVRRVACGVGELAGVGQPSNWPMRSPAGILVATVLPAPASGQSQRGS